ncbi:hypothetical protein QJS10_CPA07g00591 [Acorus calamus]|uniref:Uncharacterized protein n=1 Tax=Acorus calamus TaxID=4465 RepID=A0AAV9EGD9_ACOCL|nr:hypothetical protein QJS10_CPA07g00591 [Acorus calamus]
MKIGCQVSWRVKVRGIKTFVMDSPVQLECKPTQFGQASFDSPSDEDEDVGLPEDLTFFITN